jgi:hypothetical protein
MVNLFDLLHSKLELFRLEQRYTKRRNRRSTFVSEAQYVDGEYIYNVPSLTINKRNSVVSLRPVDDQTEAGQKSPTSSSGDSRRHSTWGSGRASNSLKGSRWGRGRDEDKRRSMVTVQETRWEER